MRPLLASLISLILLHSVTAAKFPDGAWNNKLWDKATLEKGVKNGDADALAEWAYCSANSRLNIKYDPKLIYKRSKQSAKEGSIMGSIMSSYCYRHSISAAYNAKKSLGLLKLAVDAKHPHAMARYADLNILSFNHHRTYIDLKGDMAIGLKYLKLAAAGGAVEAKFVRGRSLLHSLDGIVDKEEAFKLLVESAVKNKHLPANRIIQNEIDWKTSDTRFIDEKSAQQVAQNFKLYHLLENPAESHPRYVTEIERGSQPHTIIPQAIKLTNDKYGPMMNSMARWIRYGKWNHYASANIVIGEYSSQANLAQELYPRSYRSHYVADRYLIDLYQDPKTKKPVSPQSKAGAHAIKEFQNYFKHTPDCKHVHLSFGGYLASIGKHSPKDKIFKYRGIAHLEYMSKDRYCAYWIAGYYIYHNVTREDKIKAAAAAQWALQRDRGQWKKNQLRWYNKAMKGLNPKEKERVQELIEDGYPHADKYRRAAFELLQKVGDIPAHKKFIGQEEEEDDEDGSAMLPTPDSPIDLCDNNINPAHKGNNLDILLLKYLKGEKIQDNHKRSLVKLFTLEQKTLLAHLDKVKDQDPIVMAKKAEMLKVMKEENLIDQGKNRLGAKLGWYLIYGDEGMTSSPILTMVESGSTAEGSELWTADVIETIAGVDMKSADSRNRFKRFISLWPDNLPVQVIIRRSSYGHRNANNNGKKQKRKTTTLVFK